MGYFEVDKGYIEAPSQAIAERENLNQFDRFLHGQVQMLERTLWLAHRAISQFVPTPDGPRKKTISMLLSACSCHLNFYSLKIVNRLV